MEDINPIEIRFRLVWIYCAHASIKAFNTAFVQELYPPSSFPGEVERLSKRVLSIQELTFRPGGEQNLILASLDVTSTWRLCWYIIPDAYTIEGLNNILPLAINKGGCRIGNLTNKNAYARSSGWNTTFEADQGVGIVERYDIEIAFLNCLNTTIAGAIPIIDPKYMPPIISDSSSLDRKIPGQWSGLGIGLGFVLLILRFCCVRCLATDFDGIVEKLFPGWHSRRHPARHRGGPRVVFSHGEILPDYPRVPLAIPSLPYPMTGWASDAQTSTQTLLLYRRIGSRAECDEELPPPYSPGVVSPTRR
ncbi:hypothetical protein CPB86DRAFT_796467 [Serendipita vermifera]|nr:hypothetical protein CPB86DRAFT_796467 [Serendipita vermifera]